MPDPALDHLKLGLGMADDLQYNFPESPMFDAAFCFDGVVSISGLSNKKKKKLISEIRFKKKNYFSKKLSKISDLS